MSIITVEVCVDNIESLQTAINAGAHRIELCSSLLLGGITPTFGLTSFSVKQTHIPIYAMVRPRSGDFLFSRDEIAMMTEEIQHLKAIGVNGIVIGALTQDAKIDQQAIKQWVNAANGIGITFHRAFDLVQDPTTSLETLIDLGCQRVLTSGLHATAISGITCIKALIQQANDRISIMPGCGINQMNAKHIIQSTGATEIHLSGKTSRPSRMQYFEHTASMGADSTQDQFINVTDFHVIHDVVRQLNGNDTA
jgi:copper homeostasis protein